MAWTAPSTRSLGFLVTPTIYNDELIANLIELRQGGLAIASQAANDIIYATSATQFGRIVTQNSRVFVTSAGGVPSWSTTLPAVSGAALTSLTAANISAGTAGINISGNAATATTAATAGTVTTAAQPAITSVGTLTSLSVSGTITAGAFSGPLTGNATTATTAATVTTAAQPAITSVGTLTSLVVSTTIAASGTIKSSGQPGFLAYAASSLSRDSNDLILFDNEVYDELGNFESSVFTAPVAGRYLFTVNISTTVSSSTGLVGVTLQTSNRSYRATNGHDVGSDGVTVTLSVIADMDAADQATVLYFGTTETVIGGGSPYVTFFSGRLLV